MLRLALIGFIFLNFPLYSQDEAIDSIKSLDLNEVTIVGNRAKSLPGSGQYIGIRTLEKLNQPNVNNVLRTIPGVNIRDEEGFGLRPNIGLRGTAVNRSAKVTLMEDGILIAPAPYSDPAAYYFPTFARMHGVEVLKGSSQIKYGPYTIGGAINLISTPIPSSFRGFAQLSYGSFHTNQQRLWVGDSRKNFDYLFEVNRMASNGFKQLDNGGNTGFDRRDIMGKFRWHSDEEAKIQQSLTLKFVTGSEDGNETYLGLTYEDYQANPLRRYAGTQKDKLDMTFQNISLHYSILPAKGLSVHVTGYYAHVFRDWARASSFGGQSINNIINNPNAHQTPYLIMTGQEDGEVQYQSAARNFISAGVQANANYTFNTGEISHRLNWGIRYHMDQADRFATRSFFAMTNGNMVLTSPGLKGNQENQIRDALSISSFLSYDIQYKSLKLSPGFRVEKIEFELQNFGNSDNGRTGLALRSATNDLNILLPGIGFNYEINPGMKAFGGIHRGFSPPGMPSLNASDGQAKVETSINYELGYGYEKAGFNLELTGFLNQYDNILGTDNISGGGAGTGDMFNAGNAKIQGLELSMSYDLWKYFPLSFAYTYTSAKFEETFLNGGGDWGNGLIQKGDFIPFITPHLLTGSIGISKNRFNALLIGRYTSQTRIRPGQNEIILPSENAGLSAINAIKGFLILDLSANYKFNSTFTGFTTINNLTNNTVIVANLPQGYRPNIPLSLNFGVRAHF
jgi:Fe(3+) dicitrate transport protein